MNIRNAIRSAFLADAALVALVGQRIFTSFAPIGRTTSVNDTWVVMTKLTGAEESAHDGNQQLSHPLFQFTIGGADKEKVDEVQRLLSTYNAREFTYDDQGTPRVLTFFHRDDRDDWEPESRLHKATVDLEVWVNT